MEEELSEPGMQAALAVAGQFADGRFPSISPTPSAAFWWRGTG